MLLFAFGVQLFNADGQRHRLVLEFVLLQRSERALMRAQRKFILFFASDFVFSRDVLGRQTHVQIKVGVVFDQIWVGTDDVAAHGDHRHRFQAPASATCALPVRIRSAAMAIDCRPEEQKRFMVMALVSTGKPARIAAERAMFMPCSASGIAQPMITSSISAACNPGTRAMASLITAAPISSARVSRSVPLGALPTAVRTADTINASFIKSSAALPLDVRKGSAFPESLHIVLGGYASDSDVARRSLANEMDSIFGKAKPFRTSGGKAAHGVSDQFLN